MDDHRIYKMALADVYPLYVNKLERKGLEKPEKEVDACIIWLTGYDPRLLRRALDAKVDLKSFFEHAPRFNEKAKNIKGTICGHRVEDIKEPLMQKIRYLDKLIDELARGKSWEKILKNLS